MRSPCLDLDTPVAHKAAMFHTGRLFHGHNRQRRTEPRWSGEASSRL
jgi:hypothetical protein